jgi:hemolysin activation/secretion protein
MLGVLFGGTAWAQPATPKDPTTPETLLEWQAPAPSPAQPGAKTLKVERFRVEGNTQLPDDELRRAVSNYEGQELTLAQMKELAKQLTALYQKNGYFLTRVIVPAQQFKSESVELRVVEGRIGKVSVEGAHHYPEEYIRERFQQSFEGEGFSSARFQRTMLLMNELPDLQVKAVMTPGEEIGTADVQLRVKDALPLHGGIDYNNYGTRETGVNRVGLSAEAGNLLQTGDQFSVRGVVGFPAEQNTFYQLQYLTPLDMDGTSVSFGYANGAFAVSQGLGAILDVRGSADIYTLGFSRALDRELDFSSNLGLAISHKDVRNDFLGGTVPFSRDVYTSARLTYQADFRSADGRTLLQGAWTQGLGGTGSGDPLVSRSGASGGFTRFNFDAVRVQNIETGLYAVFRGSAQVATQPLYLAEQFAVGGPDTVRGYGQAELLGDDGYVVGAELRWSPFKEDLDAFQVAAFIDHGGVRLKRPLPGELPNGAHLTGAGFGFRWGLSDNANVRLDLGFPISPSSNRGDTLPAVYLGVQTRL